MRSISSLKMPSERDQEESPLVYYYSGGEDDASIPASPAKTNQPHTKKQLNTESEYEETEQGNEEDEEEESDLEYATFSLNA